MKKIIYAIMFMLMLGIVSAGTVTRTTPQYLQAGQQFTVTYTATDTATEYVVAIEDVITGGCTPTSYSTVIIKGSGDSATQTKTVTYTAPQSGSCVFESTAYYQFSSGSKVYIPFTEIDVQGTCTPSCPSPSTIACGQSLGPNGCGGTCSGTGTYCSSGTCSSGSCSSCVDTTWTPLPSTICTGTDFTQTSNCGNERQSVGTKSCPVCTDTCTTLGYVCGSHSICGTSTDCGDCATGETCSSGKCETSPDTKCEFYEKKVDGECEINTGLIIGLAIGLIFFKMVMG